jgi:hypothetical protein
MSAHQHEAPRHVGYAINNGVPWSDKEIAILRGMWPTHTRQQIAARLERTQEQVSRKAHHLKLGSVRINPTMPQEQQLAIARARYQAIREQRGDMRRTPERRLILDRDWPTYRPAFEIAAEMNALPGLRVSVQDLGGWAKVAGLRRPNDFRPRRDPEAPKIPPKIVARVKAPTINRRCLCCSNAFESETRFIRLCGNCRTKSEGML